MLRKTLTTICVIEVLVPETLIESAERVALENPDECHWQSWIVPGARIEGLVFLWTMWRSDESYSAFKKFLGLIGLLAFLFPRTYIDYGSKMAYTREIEPVWRSWVYPGTRLVGLVYIMIALKELRSSV